MRSQGIRSTAPGRRLAYRTRTWQIITCLLLLAFVAVPALAEDGRVLHVSALRVNTFDNPIGLSDTAPILSWQVSGVAGSGPAAMQSAYQIRVATSVSNLNKNPDMWDSGRVESSNSNNVVYEGAPLQPRQALVWDVRVWDGNGQASNWSPPATWEMGLLTNADWSAKWIENPDYTYETDGVPNPLPIFGKAFSVDGAVAKARLYMTGLGQYAAKLNGQPVGDAVLEPGQTSYFAEVNYRTYDVTSLLQGGSNVLGVETGSGAYQRVRTSGRYFFQNNPGPVYGTPKVIAQLEITYADGSVQTIDTDTSWLTKLGPTTYSAWWAGEDYDAQRIAPDWTTSAGNLSGPDWRAAGLVTLTPDTYPQDTTPLVADPRPPVTIARESHPVSITPITLTGGNTTLVAPAGAGDTTVLIASTSNFAVGDTINIDTTGSTETGTITSVGTAAGAPTTIVYPVSAGDDNVKVASVAGFADGEKVLVDTGAGMEFRTAASVGTPAVTTSLFSAASAGDTNVKVTSVDGLAVGNEIDIEPGANQDHVTITAVGTAGVNTTVSTPNTTSGLPVPAYSDAYWIWNTENAQSSAPSGTIYVRKTFDIADASAVTSAALGIAVDDEHDTYVNGTLVLSLHVSNGWRTFSVADIKPYLVNGTNVIAVAATNGGDAGSMLAAFDIDGSHNVSDDSWKALAGTPASPPDGWNTAGFDDSSWPAAFVSGLYGISPWRSNVSGPLGPTTLRVSSRSDFEAGDQISIDTGANQEVRTITDVSGGGGGWNPPPPTLIVDSALTIVHNPGAPVLDLSKPGTGIDFTPALANAHDALSTVASPGSGITFTAPLSNDHAAGAPIQGAGSGIDFTPALTSAHPFGATVTGTKPPDYVLDFGVNQSGLPKITISGEAGRTVTMVPAELINANGTVNVGSTGASASSRILYQYTLRGGGTETWHSQFTYNGFRYLQVSGLSSAPTADTITTLVTYNSSRPTASFESSSELLNSIYAVTKRALEANMQSVLTDCPDREKGPYTGDNLHNIDTELTLFDMQSFQRQMVNNMRTAQRPVPFNSDFPGLIANIAPEYHFVPPGRFLDEPNWGGAVIMIPWNLYEVYGDTKTMTENYDAMVKWLDYEATTKAEHGGNIGGLGDWSAAQSTDAQAVIDYGYYRGASTMAKIAELLGKPGDAATYAALAASLKDEYNTKYLHTDADGHAWYANNTEASNAVALDAGLVPDEYQQAVVDSLVQAVDDFGYRIGTGSVAIGPLFRTLHAAGRDDVIYQMVTNPASPGYAYLVNQGYTTLGESLSGGSSKDHHFLGQVDSWFVHALAGIQQAPDSIGYQNLLIKPAVFDDLDSVSGSYTTPAGEVTSAWQHVGKGVSFNISVPNNVTATVSLPAAGASQSYRASGNGDAVFVGVEDGREIWTVGAGQTHFQPK